MVLPGRFVPLWNRFMSQVATVCMLHNAYIVLGGPFEGCYQITACLVDDHSASRDQWVGEGLCYAAVAGQIRIALERHYPVRSGFGLGLAVYSPVRGEQAWASGGHGLGMGWVGGDI